MDFKVRRISMSLSPGLRLWLFLRGFWHFHHDSDMVLENWLSPYPNYSFINQFLGCKEPSGPLGPDFRALKDARGFWLGFSIIIMMWIWFQNFGQLLSQSLAFQTYFEGTKNPLVFQVLIWGFGGCWSFLIGFGILIMIWTWFFKFDTADLNIGFLNCF